MLRTALSATRRGVATAGRRSLNVHEFQSQAIMRDFGVNVAKGVAVKDVSEVADALQELGGGVVVKSQILAGGRGLGTFKNGFEGGVHVCRDPSKVPEMCEKMLGQTLVTKQTGSEGRKVETVYLADMLDIKREMYLAVLMDRSFDGPVIVASRQGGTSIEDIAERDPDAIKKFPVDILKGITSDTTNSVAEALGFDAGSDGAEKCADQISKLYNMFCKKDCTMLEVNPLAEVADGSVVAMDAKVSFDDNASFRQKDVFDLRDRSQEDPREVEAAKHDLNYIGLDGEIGCLVNGAGLAMATMDMIKLNGGSPANFLDVGGGATPEQVKAAFKLISSDPRVKAIFVQVFAGIVRADHVALGIINAINETGLKIPLVVRLQGTKVKEANTLLEESGLRVIAEEDGGLAAHRVVTAAHILKLATTANLPISFTAMET